MMASGDPRQIHIASHLGPAVPQHPNMPNLLSNRVYPGPGNKAPSASREVGACGSESQLHLLVSHRFIGSVNNSLFYLEKVLLKGGSLLTRDSKLCQFRSEHVYYSFC